MKYCRKLLSYHKSLYVFFVMIVVTACFTGCSQSNEGAEEKGRIEKATDNTAKAIVKKIKTPISKARDTQNLGEKRLEEMDKAMKQY